jgi:hypothetical protein
MEFYGLPPIGQKQRRPMDGAQFHPLWVGEAGGRLTQYGLVQRFPRPRPKPGPLLKNEFLKQVP